MKTKITLLIVVAIMRLTTESLGQVPSYVPSNGLVGWWPFNGNANDESGNGNDGTVNGAATSADRFGNMNNAFSFDGINDHIEVVNSPSIMFSDFSASIWVRNDNNLSFNPSRYILSKGCVPAGTNSSIDMSFRIYFEDDGNINHFVYDTWTPARQYVIGPSQTDSWLHSVVTFDGSQIRLYVNGQFYASDNHIGTLSNNSYSMIIGARMLGTGCDLSSFYAGEIDDIGIWNRALTPEEITALYNGANCAQNTMITPGVNEISIGGAATFTASSDDANPTYVWQSDLGQGYQSLNDIGNYSGTQTDSLIISNVQLAHHNQPVRVVSISGNCSDTSNVAYIQILDTCISVVQDTIFTELVDTSYVTQNIYDTLTTQVFDTTYVTLNIYDTLLTTVTDTLVIQTQISGITPETYNTLRVFPNPASTHITIDYGNFATMNGYTLTIINSLGQTVFTTLINQQTSYIDLATWTGAGMYYVQLIDPMNNTVENRKIVLE